MFYTECERPIFQTLDNNFLNYPPVYHITRKITFSSPLKSDFYGHLWGYFHGDTGMISQEISWAITLW